MALRVFNFLLFLLYCEVISGEVSDKRWKTIEDTDIKIPIKDYCKNKTCLPKCCPKGQLMKPPTGICRLPNNTSEFKVIEKYTEFIKNSSLNDITNIHWVRDIELTKSDIIHINWTIHKDLSLTTYYIDAQNYSWLGYCLDIFTYNNNTIITLAVKVKPFIDLDANTETIFNIIGRAISSFFILLVLLVYCLLPSLRHMGGLLLMAHLLSLLIGYMIKFFQDLNTIPEYTIDAGPNFCQQTSAAFYFFILASFFWLNIMSFDIWCITRGYKVVPRKGEEPRVNYRKLILYGLYAWGIPALLTAIIVIIHHYKLDANIGFPFESCFSSANETRLFLNLPIGIMTAVNIIFFSMTAYNIWKSDKKLSIHGNSNSTKKSKTGFFLNFKLFIIMGISWILEQVPTDPGTVSAATYMSINFCNVFIGVFIFIFYVCKKDVYHKLRKRFNYRDTSKNRSTKYSRTETTSS